MKRIVKLLTVAVIAGGGVFGAVAMAGSDNSATGQCPGGPYCAPQPNPST